MNNDEEILRIAFDRIEMLLQQETDKVIQLGILMAQNVIGSMQVEVMKINTQLMEELKYNK